MREQNGRPKNRATETTGVVVGLTKRGNANAHIVRRRTFGKRAEFEQN